MVSLLIFFFFGRKIHVCGFQKIMFSGGNMCNMKLKRSSMDFNCPYSYPETHWHVLLYSFIKCYIVSFKETGVYVVHTAILNWNESGEGLIIHPCFLLLRMCRGGNWCLLTLIPVCTSPVSLMSILGFLLAFSIPLLSTCIFPGLFLYSSSFLYVFTLCIVPNLFPF